MAFDPLTAQTGLTAEQRSLRARAAAFAMHAQGGTNTGPATRASMARFEAIVDPEGRLAPAIRARRAAQARRAYMAGLALKSSKARSHSYRKTAPAIEMSEAVTTEGHGNDQPSA